MNLILTHQSFNSWGIISALTDESGKQIATCLEHAYLQDDGSYLPKTPDGTYTCVRGQHQLAGMSHPFETFEITNVPGHTNILLHVGNYNKDSEGCVLVGADVAPSEQMIVNSKAAFANFMSIEAGLDSFTLTVTSVA